MSLATACVCDLALGPYEGKQTGELALLRDLLNAFDENDLVVPSRLRACFDRYYCPFEAQGMSYMMLAIPSRLRTWLMLRGVHVCARLHQRRLSDFRRGRRLGPDDHGITWTRPVRPEWMSEAEYTRIPETLTLREVRFHVAVPGRRTETLTVITTLTDADVFSKEDIATLYGSFAAQDKFRWNLALSCEGVELDIRSIKQTPALSCEGLGLDHVRCKTPDMVRRELWVTLLAYNLIRTVIAAAAAVHQKQPRQLGFALACQTILASWMLYSTGSCSDPRAMYTTMLTYIAANQVANRPGRLEPRVLKRRRHHYPLMQRPRHELRAQLRKT